MGCRPGVGAHHLGLAVSRQGQSLSKGQARVHMLPIASVCKSRRINWSKSASDRKCGTGSNLEKTAFVEDSVRLYIMWLTHSLYHSQLVSLGAFDFEVSFGGKTLLISNL